MCMRKSSGNGHIAQTYSTAQCATHCGSVLESILGLRQQFSNRGQRVSFEWGADHWFNIGAVRFVENNAESRCCKLYIAVYSWNHNRTFALFLQDNAERRYSVYISIRYWCRAHTERPCAWYATISAHKVAISVCSACIIARCILSRRDVTAPKQLHSEFHVEVKKFSTKSLFSIIYFYV